MKVFNRAKYFKNMKMSQEEIDNYRKKHILAWFDECEGKEVINGVCNGVCCDYIISDEWCSIKENKTMKKKIRDLTSEEYGKWELKNCSGIDCRDCPFKYVNCKCEMWVNHKDMYSNKFLDQEVDIPSPHILDKEEHDYLRAVIKPYKVNYIIKTETGYDNYFIGIVVKSSVYCGLTAELSMPYFTKGSMYKNMEVNKKYTIEELELDKEWEE